jgi:hypothetical protein
MKQEILRLRVVRLLANGTLPPRNPAVSAGYGEDLLCDVCGELITGGQVQYDFADDAGRVLHLHLQCHQAWQNALADVQSEQHER